MEEMIKRILQVDDANDELLQKASERRESVNAEIETEKKRIADEAMQVAKSKVDKMQAAESSRAQDVVSADKVKFEGIISSINLTYQNNKQAWISEIVKNVVKQEW